MRLIDADVLKKEFPKDTDWEYPVNTNEYVCEKIDEQPTIEERKTGEWLEITSTNHTYVCSVCGRMLVNITDGKNKVTKNYPFCHCGADMRGEQDDPNCD